VIPVRFSPVITFLLVIWIPAHAVAQNDVDSLFATVAATADDPEAYLKALKDLVKAHPEYAPAYHEIAKLYMAQGTPQSRQNAKRAIEKTLRLDTDNVTYQMTLGDLLWAQGFRSKAEAQFKKIYNRYPDNAEAAYMIGQQKVKQFYHYQDMGRAFKYLAQEDLKKAILHLNRSIELNPKFRDPYYLLGVLYFDQRQPDRLVALSDQLLQRDPDDKDAYLFKGLGLQTQGFFEEAYEAYKAALARMNSEERAQMESVEWVVDEDERGLVNGTDNSEREKFWQQQDPLFLTSFNERRMAHYGRIAYANLHFSRPSKGIGGWQTDMGKTYIRFGSPIRKQTIRPYIFVPEKPTEIIVHTHREHWFYEGFKLTFQNWDGLDGWYFATVDVAALGGEVPTTDRLATEVFKKTPSRYVDPYIPLKYSIPYQLVRFKEADSIRVELSYAVPTNKLLTSENSSIVDLEDGLFLFDEHWQPVYRNVQDVSLDLSKIYHSDIDSLRQNNLLSMRTLKVKPGDYQVIVEARSRNTGTIGTVRQPNQFTLVDQKFSASDLLLARQIEPLIPFPEGRKDLRIMPNPMRTFYRHDPVYIYLEVYNLKRDDFGQTRYEITYQLTPPKDKDIDPTLFLAVDYTSKQGMVEIEAQQKNRELGIDDRGRSDPIPGADSVGDEEGKEQPENIEAKPDQAIDQILKGESQKSAAIQYQVKYVLPKSQLSEEFSKLAKNGIDITRSISAEYEGRSENDFTFLQIDVAQVPVGFYQLVVVIRDLQTGESLRRKTLFRVIQ